MNTPTPTHGPDGPARMDSTQWPDCDYVEDYTVIAERPIMALNVSDGAGWLHKIFVGADADNGNLTFVRYDIERDGVSRFHRRKILGPDNRTATPENVKLDGATAWRAGQTVYIAVVGHIAGGQNAIHTFAFPDVWRHFPEPAGQTFPDVPPENVFYPFIEQLAGADVVHGKADGLFHPEQSATRGQISAMIVGATETN